MREVQHVGQPEDQRQPGRDQEVQRGQAEAGDSVSRTIGATSACTSAEPTPSSDLVSVGVAEQRRAAAPVQATLPGGEHDGVARPSRRTTARFCSTSSTGTAAATRSSTSATSVTTFGRQALGRLVDQQQPVVG